ncbi:MAG: electron transfer flavoprotein subunit alpha/FixB family protein, partial [Bacteroidota bacterium]
KKAVFEAATYAYDLAQSLGTELVAVSVGEVDGEELGKLGTYGVSKVYNVSGSSFVNAAFAQAVSKVAEEVQAKAVVMAQTYNGRAISPRVAVKLDASPLSGMVTLPDPANHFAGKRMAYSGKGVQDIKAPKERIVITVKTNAYKIDEHPAQAEVVDFDASVTQDLGIVAKEIVKASSGISLTEAETVVSAGRGMKGPENWSMIEELATLLGAATASSKPVADMGWRPHHEHVGQTGIQIAPNLYIAVGISGAIQHLAGVSSSKNIIVINKDPEAPFFKIADFGVVGDLFDVVPQLLEEIKKAKAAA